MHRWATEFLILFIALLLLNVPAAYSVNVTCPSLASSLTQGSLSSNYTGYVGFILTVSCPWSHFDGMSVDSVDLTCQANGTWDSILPTCPPPVYCPAMNLPDHMTRSTEETLAGTDVVYTCARAHTYVTGSLNTTQTIECQPDGSWSSEPLECVARHCDPPPELPNTKRSTTDTWYGTSVEYDCEFDMKFADGSFSISIECISNLTWSRTTGFPLCESRVCGAPTLPAHSTADELPLVSGSEVGISCDEGYQFADGQTYKSIKCEKSETWSGIDVGDCEIVTCRPFPELENANLVNTTNNTAGDSYNDTAVWECSLEHSHFPAGGSNFTSTCSATGEWQPAPPVSGCQRGTCPGSEGWNLYELSCFYASDPYQEGVRFTGAETLCNFKGGRLAHIENTEERDYLYELSYGATGKDYWIGYHRTDVDSPWGWIGNMSTTYTSWIAGYPEFFSCARLAYQGYWKDKECVTPSQYLCRRPQICGAEPSIANGRCLTPGVISAFHGSKLDYECDFGYVFQSTGLTSKTIICEDGGYYSAIESCTAMRCPDLPLVAKAVLNSTTFTTGSVVMYTCKTGYSFNDGSLAKGLACKGNQWNTSVDSSCTSGQCTLPAVLNAVPQSNVSGLGQSDVYACLEGFHLPGLLDIKTIRVDCLATGQWHPSVPQCLPNVCTLPTISRGSVNKESAVFSDIIEVTCDTGFILQSGSVSTLTCLSNQSWSAPIPVCEGLPCPSQPVVYKAVSSINATIATSQIEYTCVDGYVYPFDGTKLKTAYCQPDSLEWTYYPPGCIPLLEFLIWSDTYPLKFEQVANWTFLGIGYIFLLLAFTVLVIAMISSLLGSPTQNYNQTPSEATDKSLDILRADMEMSLSGPMSFRETNPSAPPEYSEDHVYVSNTNSPDPMAAPMDAGKQGSSKGRLSRKSTRQELGDRKVGEQPGIQRNKSVVSDTFSTKL